MQLEMEVTVPNTPLFNGGAGAVVREELRGAAEASVLIIQGEIIPRTPVGATGTLRRGTVTQVVGDSVNILGRVFNPVGYAVSMEAGTKPHFPPTAPLELWVRRVLGVPGDQTRSVAFLVARAISRRGTKGRYFFRDGFAAAKGRVLARFAKANERIASRLAGKA